MEPKRTPKGTPNLLKSAKMLPKIKKNAKNTSPDALPREVWKKKTKKYAFGPPRDPIM